MKEVIESDFSVNLISKNETTELFGALRKGGTETIRAPLGLWVTHVMGVWHLVLNHSVREENFTRNQVSQWHIPRYEMATQLERLTRAGKRHPNAPRPLLNILDEGLSLAIFGENQLGVAFSSGEMHTDLKKAFQSKLRKEVVILKAAQKNIIEEGDTFVLPEVRTPAGHQVQSKSRELIEAVAFEHAVLGDLDAGNFGIYSAFCTQVDFDTTREMPSDLIRSLITEQMEHGEALWNLADRTDAFIKVQEMLFPKQIWGPGVNLDQGEAEQILAEGMARLKRSQRVQFVLMNGMHAAGLLLPLCVISGLATFEEYVSILCRYDQPDSPEEQDRRKEAAFIKLFGKLSEG
jgi:hypothetical protein